MTTLADVAERAGCSIAAASRALNARGAVSEGLQRRVRKAATELGYRTLPLLARRHGRRPVVGVLIPSITNPVFATSLSNIQNRMLIAGHAVLIAQSNYDPLQEAGAIAALLSERPTGLILTLCNAEGEINRGLDLPPTVLLNNLPTDRFPAAVTVDNQEAGRILTRHILLHGHERILFLSGNFQGSDRARLRYDGYREVMEQSGLPPLAPFQIPFIGSYEQIDLSATLWDTRPTAIIASNDLLAFGVIGALRKHGYRVPEEISVAGFDGIAVGQLMSPRLTTIEMPDASMGAVAASLLIDMTENGAPSRHLQMGFTLRQGETVRAVRT
ncbi:substrate-binding domain-containing protein [Rhizobium sp. TRM95111]|uniref:LacI family DNA-binding transcriptional regulator n=1 Tax=Rhizobium alarense TaxID=2846851 RepID=UPI001F34A1D7|nr:substrate-binding domain-containing protein [Rhizobium alarense]MCF3639286.1 substrate-binding domain-containing protein [Rhizobium alarense]